MKIDNLEPKKPSRNHFSSMSKTQKLLLLTLIPIAGFSILPIIFVLLIGLLPTLTIMITEADNSNKLAIVGCFNVAGAFIYLFNIINSYDTGFNHGLEGSIFNLIIMLGAAAIGILLYRELPNLFVMLAKTSAEKKLKHIDEALAQISENWGDEIILKNTPKSPKN